MSSTTELDERIIQVKFSGSKRTFAYRYTSGDPIDVGDRVIAPTFFDDNAVATVIGFGRTDYTGPLKVARKCR